MRRLVLGLSLLALASCNPELTGADPDGAAPPRPDAGVPQGPIVDAGQAPVTMWAHSADTLFAIDSATFDMTVIGTFDVDDSITDIAVTPDGTLYGISMTRLYSIDFSTAKATYVAGVPGVSNVGLTFLPDGTLLATDKSGGVRQIDPHTGMVTELGTFGGGYATAGDLVAVVDGTMYAISDRGSATAYDSNILLTVNTSTGTAQGIGEIGFGHVFGAAYANGHVYAFTTGGQLIEIDRITGAGRLVRTYSVGNASVEFWGAAVTPLVWVQ